MNQSPLKVKESLVDVLLTTPYEELLKKQDKTEFFNQVFNYSADNSIIVLRDLMLMDFIPNEKLRTINSQIQDKMIEYLASLDPKQDLKTVEQGLKQIVPEAKLPEKFDLVDYQSRAVGIYHGLRSLKKIIAENAAQFYMNDILFLLGYPENRLKEIVEKARNVNDVLAKEFERVIAGNKVNNETLNPAFDLIKESGRSQAYINRLKDRMILGDISEMTQKIERAVNIALDIRKRGIDLNNNQAISQAIQNYLYNDINLT